MGIRPGDLEGPDGSPVVVLHGDIDLYNAPTFEARLDEAIQGAAHRRLFVDCTDLTFIDSTGLNVLIGAARRMRAKHQGGEVVLTNVPHQAAKIIEITGLDRVFTMTRAVEVT